MTTTITRTYQYLTENLPSVGDGGLEGEPLPQVVTVQASSNYCAHVEVEASLTADRAIIDSLEVVPTDFGVGDTVYMEWLCNVKPVGGGDEGMCLEVSSISGWDKDLGAHVWHHPQPVEGERKYLVTLPAQYCHHLRDGGLSWTKDAVATVLRVL